MLKRIRKLKDDEKGFDRVNEMSFAESSQVLSKIQNSIAKVMIGREETIRLLLASFAAGGHVLIEDVPGTGKTVMARSLAASAGLAFSRIQFTPDLLPSDVTGLNYFNQEKSRFVFRQGPVFSNILLADEINRATPRTQSALLECMAEGQVTVDGETRKLEEPFFVVATQNPVETLGTFPLPEAQLDRFLMKIEMGSMSEEEEIQMIGRFIEDQPLEHLEAVVSLQEISSVRADCRRVYVHDDLRRYVAQLVQRTRSRISGSMTQGVSPRGTLSLIRAAQGYALVQGRDYVVPEDIRAVTYPVLVHRCLASGITSDREKKERVSIAVSGVEVPTEDWRR